MLKGPGLQRHKLALQDSSGTEVSTGVSTKIVSAIQVRSSGSKIETASELFEMMQAARAARDTDPKNKKKLEMAIDRELFLKRQDKAAGDQVKLKF